MSRTMCSILEGMRESIKTLNFSYMLGLVEEAQQAAWRMETAISDRKDCLDYTRYRHEIKEQIYELYKIYLEKCAELKVKPKKREAWCGSQFKLLDKQFDDTFFTKEDKKDNDE